MLLALSVARLLRALDLQRALIDFRKRLSITMPSRVIVTEIVIDAPPSRVFDVFGRFDDLSKRQTWLNIKSPANIEQAVLHSNLDVTLTPAGGKPFSIQPEVVNNEAGKGFAWRGKLWGCSWWFVGEHKFEFLELPGGRTKFVHSEHFSGMFIPLLAGVITQAAQEFEKFNMFLKQLVEN